MLSELQPQPVSGETAVLALITLTVGLAPTGYFEAVAAVLPLTEEAIYRTLIQKLLVSMNHLKGPCLKYQNYPIVIASQSS